MFQILVFKPNILLLLLLKCYKQNASNLKFYKRHTNIDFMLLYFIAFKSIIYLSIYTVRIETLLTILA